MSSRVRYLICLYIKWASVKRKFILMFLMDVGSFLVRSILGISRMFCLRYLRIRQGRRIWSDGDHGAVDGRVCRVAR